MNDVEYKMEDQNSQSQAKELTNPPSLGERLRVGEPSSGMGKGVASLRALEPEDLDLLYRIENDAELWDVGLTTVPYSRYVLRDYIAHATADIYTDRQVRLVVERTDGTVVGLLDLVNFDPKHRRAEIGIVVERPHRRQGFALEAIRQALDYARQTLHLHQVYALVAADNEPARQLFIRAGFTPTAHLSQWLTDGTDWHDVIVMQRIL